jgi:hypothetical protein
MCSVVLLPPYCPSCRMHYCCANVLRGRGGVQQGPNVDHVIRSLFIITTVEPPSQPLNRLLAPPSGFWSDPSSGMDGVAAGWNSLLDPLSYCRIYEHVSVVMSAFRN